MKLQALFPSKTKSKKNQSVVCCNFSLALFKKVKFANERMVSQHIVIGRSKLFAEKIFFFSLFLKASCNRFYLFALVYLFFLIENPKGHASSSRAENFTDSLCLMAFYQL